MTQSNNLLVITYWSFGDALIQAYTLPYVKLIKRQIPSGSRIHLFTLEQRKHAFSQDKIREIKGHLREEGIVWKPYSYSPFGIKMMLKWGYILISLLTLIYMKKISTIQAWCTPAGAIGYILSKLTRRSLELDSFDPHAEPMVEARQWKPNSLAFKILFNLEKKQAQHASVVIGCVDKMQEYSERKYGVKLKNFYSKPACVNFSLFDVKKAKNEELLEELGLKDKTVCVYAGKFGGSYLKQEIFDFFKVCLDQWENNFRVLLLSAHSRDEVEDWAQKARVPTNIVIQRFVPHDEVPEYVGLGDFAIVPFVPVPSKRYGSPIKTGEYMAMGLPLVITKDISDDSDLIERYKVGFVLRELILSDYQRAVNFLSNNLSATVKNRVLEVAAREKSFDKVALLYRNVYSS